MSNLWTAIAAGIAFGLGWVGRSFFLHPSVPATVVFQALVAIGVAWLIHSALRRNAELGRVPISAADTACERINELTNKCLIKPHGTLGNDPDLVLALRSLDHEVSWLCLVASTLGCKSSANEMLRNSYEELYDAASLGKVIDHGLCFPAGQRVRARTLRLQWEICELALKGASNASRLRAAIHKLTD